MSYFATSTIDVTPVAAASQDYHAQQYLRKSLSNLLVPNNICNKTVYRVDLVHRRRSGRGISASYSLSATDHSIQYIAPKKAGDEGDAEEDTKLLQGLTTFNLTTSDRQKEARDKVELPFLQAQEVGEGGARGGAVIYEFEKDDDYDEEDPYEDPF
ncbi:Elongator subunit IKI1 [Sugiyamaella lignohabitans]|uniref:Elongator complex protein 5 n=1 Tax=Sugiyamaella lignohabitans TaxID=796027 RepID=A0A167DVN2_9ASCO|nr:Elongator subunit IKI1 [Sugiyamaella lignohabitans]ANB13345.1 Elongator subunit IKI1 [Sugiyamaella lignohabitans]